MPVMNDYKGIKDSIVTEFLEFVMNWLEHLLLAVLIGPCVTNMEITCFKRTVVHVENKMAIMSKQINGYIFMDTKLR